ncbi:DUF4139 domain-containing protein [Roseovarius sp.]|uniref:DUF4139 domain-containing protein n=1 Tax=Roseovarius sp. TaxID=1486281 RepID=UPI00262368B4|nr:DUF4139 domain-containing protein [Roseovarius sp.]MDM8167345.1 DUF4139 domain-containing protein [Roseovarius sp.]
MQRLAFALALLPTAVLAEDIPLASDVTGVTLYPNGATVTRRVPFSAPAGAHQLVLTDLPRSTPLASVRVAVEGAQMGSVSTRNDFVPPRTEETNAAIEAAEDRVELLEEELRNREAAIESIRLEAKAAEARVDFLESLGKGEGVAALDVEKLMALSEMIGSETLEALQAAQGARRRAEAAARDLKDLQEDLRRARQALAALVPEQEDRAMLAVAVRSDAPAEGMLTVTYNIYEAGWQPVYDLRLERDTGDLDIERGALVYQQTGENWSDVALTLSTTRPTEQTVPGEVWPWLRRIFDPEVPVPMPKPLVRAEPEAGYAADAAMEEALVEAAPVQAAAQFDGLSVTYSYPETVNVATGADNLRITLGTLEAEAEMVAQAVPLTDTNAYLMAEFTNEAEELILPTHEASFYLDGRFIGKRPLDLIPAGGEAELSFGPIEGLRLERTVLGRNEGDRGMISRSTELTEEVRIEIENLTGEAWPMRVLDRVPYSEQEDLEIDWNAAPHASEMDVDGKRGVLAWEFEIAAGEEKEITLTHTLEWPEGMVLQ